MINEKEYAKVIAVNLRNIMYDRHALTDHVSVTDLLAVSAFQNPFQDNSAPQ